MSHRIHNTDAFVIGVEPASENSAYVRFWTRELGLLGVWCQGVRQMRSKLRHHTTLLAHTNLSLVQGRQMWRLVGADTRNLEQIKGKRILQVAHRILGAGWRLVPREEIDPLFFDRFRDAFLSASSRGLLPEELEGLELSLMLGLLGHTGYLEQSLAGYRDLPTTESEHLLKIHGERSRIVPVINQALLASQL